jgi:hypothetical protein
MMKTLVVLLALAVGLWSVPAFAQIPCWPEDPNQSQCGSGGGEKGQSGR